MALSDLMPKPGGVALAPPSAISLDLERQVQAVLDTMPADTTTAALDIHTKRGVNLVIASKSANGKLTASMWVGKSGWDQPINEGWAAGVQVRATWGGAPSPK